VKKKRFKPGFSAIALAVSMAVGLYGGAKAEPPGGTHPSPAPTIPDTRRELVLQLKLAKACLMTVEEPLKGKNDQASKDLETILAQIAGAEDKLKIPKNPKTITTADCRPKQQTAVQAVQTVSGELDKAATSIKTLQSLDKPPSNASGDPQELKQAADLVSDARDGFKKLQPKLERGTPLLSGTSGGQSPSLQLQLLANDLGHAAACIKVMTTTQVVMNTQENFQINKVLDDLKGVRTQFNLLQSQTADAECQSGSTQTEEALRGKAKTHLQNASTDFWNFLSVYIAHIPKPPTYTPEQLTRAGESISDAIVTLNQIAPSAPKHPSYSSKGRVLQALGILLSIAVLGILVIMLTQSSGRKKNVLQKANAASNAAELVLKQATEAEARITRQFAQQQAIISKMNAEYQQGVREPLASLSSEVSLDRDGNSPEPQTESFQNEDLLMKSGAGRPAIIPEQPVSADRSARLVETQSSPEMARDPKTLTGNPVEDYNRCLGMSPSEADDRFFDRYKEARSLTCTNLEDRSPNAKLVFKFDTRGNFLVILTGEQMPVLPKIGLDPVDSRRSLEGVFQYPAGNGKVKLFSHASVTTETADTFVICDRGEFVRG